ncbi:MAG: hypothetical protein JWN73_2064 [Betaproteobacteria bacterium]|nr:hypothetical protein [Betaproteobacteria bacterium]
MNDDRTGFANAYFDYIPAHNGTNFNAVTHMIEWHAVKEAPVDFSAC